jgi:hypothetical protein
MERIYLTSILIDFSVSSGHQCFFVIAFQQFHCVVRDVNFDSRLSVLESEVTKSHFSVFQSFLYKEVAETTVLATILV